MALEAVTARPSAMPRTQQSSRYLPLTNAGEAFIAVAGVLAVSGLAELFFQRIVYRVGVHIPRQGAFLEAYRFATVSGDFAFRTTAVLLAVAAGLAVFWLWRRRSYTTVALLVALLTANLLAWPFGVRFGAQVAPIVFAFGAAWLTGQALRGEGMWLKLAAASAGVALALSQYRAGMTALGNEPGHVAEIQLASEVALLATAAFVGMAAARTRISPRAVALSSLLTLGLLASYTREPSTVAIVSLWATGVTMSLPGMLYIAGFGLVAFAALTWLRDRHAVHLSIALALLMVAGLQPQALHHGITAFLGLAILNARPGDRTEVRDMSEVEDAV
jgi:hypothetical protein